MIYLLTHSCHPERSEGSREHQLSLYRFFGQSPQQLVFTSFRMTKSVKKYIVPYKNYKLYNKFFIIASTFSYCSLVKAELFPPKSLGWDM